MADAIVSVVMEQLVSTIRLEVEQKVRLVVGVRKQVDGLSTAFRSVQAVLQDAEKKQITSDQVKNWLGELKDIAYDVQDVLDEWKTRILISQSSLTDHHHASAAAAAASLIKNKVLSCLSSPCSCFHPVAVRYDIAQKIKLIRERFDEVARNKDQFNFIESQSPQERPHPRLLTSSVANVSKIYGRDHDKEAILSRLLGDTSSHVSAALTVVSIVGTGGFGKTTLAQLIFNDATIVNTFELKIWVCVSEPFERERVAKEIIQLAGGNVHDVVGWEGLHQRLCSSVKGKQFLLVLDDVWSENPDDWTPLQLSLEGGAQGSRIMVTTRNEKVAKLLGSTYTHRLGVLSDDDCWSLFQQIAFLGRSQEDRERLEEIGKEITGKCKGVPLAVKTIASLMCVKQTKQDWRNVLASDTWKLQQLENGFSPALLLSYHALPSNVKQCFLYCAIFPKDTIMEKDVLVKLWMAQGYLDSDGGKELEMIGGYYFDDLAMRSFFQDFKKDGSGSIISCKMHDLVHDLAQFLVKTEWLVTQENEMEVNYNKVRHMTYSGNENLSTIYKLKNLRTLTLHLSSTEEPPKLHQLTCLRALDLSNCKLRELPRELEGLLHLRYLDFSDNSDIVELPETICSLYNLQTLKLNWCRGICRLPEEIGSLVNLRHLQMKGTDGLKFFPGSIGRLSQLRTLSKFVVSGNDGGCTIRGLGNIKYLSGHLEICGLRQVGNANEAKRAELHKKSNINSLELQFGGSDQETEEVEEMKRMESVLESLEPHNNLEALRIDGYPGLAFPRWMSSEASSSSLSNIVTLQLVSCNRCTLSPPGLGQLRYLEGLVIGLGSVKKLGPDFCGGAGVAVAGSNKGKTSFPKLMRLELSGMRALEDWVIIKPSSKVENKFMPCLRVLSIKGCPKLKRLLGIGRLESLEEIWIEDLASLESVGDENLRISDGAGKDSDFGGGESERFLPRLREVSIRSCPKLKTLAALLRISLKGLELSGLDAVKNVSSEVFGISSSGGGSNAESSSSVVFPNLRILTLDSFTEWEGKEIEETTTSAATTTTGGVSMFPSLENLLIKNCRKLKVVPHYLFPHTLRRLGISDCPQLAAGVQPCLPPLLERLSLYGDVGVLWSSLLPIFTPHNSTSSSSSSNSYPNLKEFLIMYSRQSSLPQGLNQLTSLEELWFNDCELLDFKPGEELRHFPMLQRLIIGDCPVLRERCRRENWSSSSDMPYAVYVE